MKFTFNTSREIDFAPGRNTLRPRPHYTVSNENGSVLLRFQNDSRAH